MSDLDGLTWLCSGAAQFLSISSATFCLVAQLWFRASGSCTLNFHATCPECLIHPVNHFSLTRWTPTGKMLILISVLSSEITSLLLFPIHNQTNSSPRMPPYLSHPWKLNKSKFPPRTSKNWHQIWPIRKGGRVAWIRSLQSLALLWYLFFEVAGAFVKMREEVLSSNLLLLVTS